ncbi:hypothetical protein N9N08_00525 [bacterium]|jgi:hypothetical protein|nr:hypothetical protein [bacterium]
MISNRNGYLVVGKFSVPIREITECIVERQELEKICNKYPVTEEDVFESLDAIADLDSINSRDRLKCKNVGNLEDIQIQTVSITDNLFLKIVQYGRVVNDKVTDFNKLFDIGFLNLAYECYEDIHNGHRQFENSEIHIIVFDAVESMIDGQISMEDIFNLLQIELDDIKV